MKYQEQEVIKYYKHGSILTPLWIYLDAKRMAKRGYTLTIVWGQASKLVFICKE